MNLDDTQRQTVSAWIAEGLKLSEIQSRLAAEFGLRLTYMEVRLLVDDLKLTPMDPEPATPTPELSKPAATGPGASDDEDGMADPVTLAPEKPTAGTGKVSVSVDKIAVPGTLVSGSVTFSDGQTAQWYLDEMGRLGIAAKQKGYRPSQPDVQAFQAELQRQMGKLGF